MTMGDFGQSGTSNYQTKALYWNHFLSAPRTDICFLMLTEDVFAFLYMDSR